MCERKFVKPLHNVTKCDCKDIGAKAVNLGEMIRAGMPVPDGFVVLTSAYGEFVQTNGIDKKIAQILAGIHKEHYEKIEEAEKKISILFDNSNMPDEIVRQITEAYKEFDNYHVVVRSSATAEDLPGMSFAGQYESYLNITGIKDICDSIKKCWLSLWNARAISYRLKQQVPQEQLALGIIVQQLVNGERSGILFTANPLNGRRDQMLINASWGLGEAVVSSLVSPDQWVIDKENGNIIDASISTKKVMTIAAQKGTITSEVPVELQKKPTLSNDEIQKLIEIGKKIEDQFQAHQDLEWIFEDEKLYLVQSRPITSLFPIPENQAAPKNDLRIFINMNLVDQGLTEPLTPMGADIWKMYLKYMTYNMSEYITAEGRIFADPTDRLRMKHNWKNITFYFETRDPMATKALLQWLERNEKAILGKGKSLKMSAGELKSFIGVAGNWLYGELFPEKARNRMITVGENAFNLYHTGAKTLNSFDQKRRFIEETVKHNAMLTMAQAFYVIPAVLADSKVEKLSKSWLGDTKDLEVFRRALPYNKTTEMGMEMLRIATLLKDRNIKPSPDMPEIQDFLRKYGHRANVEIDTGIPRWREDPSYVIQLITSYMAQGNAEEKLQKFYESMKESTEAEKRIIEDVRQKKGKLASIRMKRLLHHIKEQLGLRELPKFELVRGIALLRDVLQSMGNDLVKEEKLDKADDIFYITMNDLNSGNNLKTIAASNKGKYKRYAARPVSPRLISSIGESIYALTEEGEVDTLKGIPVSPGIYEGKVKIAYTPSGAELKPGEILVVQCTNPAWTPLFLNAGALIMETGGALSHGAIVAREYGVPAVAEVNSVTTLLKDGQTVRVNGQSGQVVIIK